MISKSTLVPSKNFLIKKAIVVFLFLMTFSSCSDQHQRAKLMVEDYNQLASNHFSAGFARVNPKILYRTYAILLEPENGGEVIKVDFISKFAFNDPTINIYKKLIPIAFTNYIAAEPNSSYLIKHGAKFKVSYTSRNGKSSDELIIDQKKMDELLKEKAGQNLAVGKDNRNADLKPGFKQLLISLNNGLPLVVDEEMQLRVIKIDVNSLNELVYDIEVGRDTGTTLMGEAAGAEMKKRILSNPTIRRLLTQVKAYGLSNIKYSYKDQSGKQLNSIVISEADLMP